MYLQNLMVFPTSEWKKKPIHVPIAEKIHRLESTQKPLFFACANQTIRAFEMLAFSPLHFSSRKSIFRKRWVRIT